MKRKLYTAGILLSACVALFSGIMVYRHYAADRRYTGEFRHLAEMVGQPPDGREPAQTGEGTATTEAPEDGDTVLEEYARLYEQNSDLVGWIRIEGTSVNYPVMQTPEEPDYYLKRDFNRQYSDYGVPYAAADCDVLKPSDNVILYGHNIKNGAMFGALEDYKEESFFEEHRVVRFDTLTERAEYEILAVFKTAAYPEGGFPWYSFVDADGEEAFDAYVSACKELALYDTGVTAEYGDKLITLSTCEYSRTDGRLMLVAKKLWE